MKDEATSQPQQRWQWTLQLGARKGIVRLPRQEIHDSSSKALVMANIAMGSIVRYAHRLWNQRAAKREGNPEPIMPRVHRGISNFQT